MSDFYSVSMISQRGKSNLVIDGYKFGFHKRLKDDIERWKCNERTCNAAVKIFNAKVVDRLNIHNHKKPNVKLIERQKLSNSVKRKAAENVNTRPSKLVQVELQQVQDKSHLSPADIKLVKRCIYRATKQPQNTEIVEPEIKLEEEVYHPFICEDYSFDDMTLQAIKYQEGSLEVLDQLLLPMETKYIKINSVEDGWEVINSMQVRGAPAIAIVGCLSLAVELYICKFESKTDLFKEIENKLNYLITARPTAVNMANEAAKLKSMAKKLLIDDELNTISMKKILIGEIENMLAVDIHTNEEIGKYGAETIINSLSTTKINVLTHCNAGSLATAGYGTALGVIRSLHKLKKIDTVYCTETRPYLQGARLTSYELLHDNIPSTLICDNAVGALFNTKKIKAVVVGADRVASNGDTANKIGTYQIAVLAKYHNVDFYVCAPLSTCDFKAESGLQFIIEERPKKEMIEIMGKNIAPPEMNCWSPAFDVTPANLITGIITDKGVVRPNELNKLKGL